MPGNQAETRETPVKLLHRLEEAARDGSLHGLSSAVDVELVVDLLEVAIHRLGGDPQTRRDLLVLEAQGEELEDIELAGPVRMLRSHFIDGVKSMPVRFRAVA